MKELKYLEEAKKLIGKAFTDVYIEDPFNIEIEKFPTGSIYLDAELKGGYPKGKLAEFYGKQQSGKTTACIEGAAQFQKKYPDEQILWIDLEDTFDAHYCTELGLDTSADSNFTLLRPSTGEEAYEIFILFAKHEKGGLIVLDSVALLLPSAEDEGDMGKAAMGSQARLNSQGMRKLFPHSRKNKTTIFFINQTREKLGVMFGNPETTAGGNAIPFYCRTRLRFSASQGEKDNDGDFMSTKTTIYTEKATFGHEKRKVIVNIVYGQGFDSFGELIDLAIELDIIQKSGSWFSYNETKIGQGKDSVKELLADNIEMYEEIEKQVVSKIRENV